MTDNGRALPDVADLEIRAQRLLAAVPSLDRPYMVELFGLPKSGKTTVGEMMRDFFRRNGFEVAAPQEGARAVELPRVEPQINFAYTEYALAHARRIAADRRIDVGILDRAIWDGAVRMGHYRRTGQMTDDEATSAEGYILSRWNRDLFDAHVCLMADPVTALDRKNALLVSKRQGATTNPKKMNELRDAHLATWKEHSLDASPKHVWVDSTDQSPMETVLTVLDAVLGAFERRLRNP